MNRHALQLECLLNRPLALETGKAALIQSALARHGLSLPLELMVGNPVRTQAGEGFSDPDDGWYGGVPMLVHGSVAVIPISGILLSGPGGWLYPYVSFYEDIRCQFNRAVDDDRIKAIALWIDSPGGVASQCFDLAEHIFKARSRKPIVSIVYDMACSAAYALACAADTVTVPASGITGSVGVIMIHSEYSEMLERAGIKTTIFRYGDHKANLQPVEPVTQEAAARTQTIINSMGDQFVTHVARCRNLTFDQVRDQQADVYLGSSGVQARLADAVMPPHDALDDLISRFNQ